MDELKFNAPITDASYLAHANTFFTTLYGLDIFRNGWSNEKLGSQEVLQNEVDFLRQKYQGGLNGNRIDIAARKMARKDLDVRIQKILYYLAVMAEQNDIAALLNSGVVTYKIRKRARKSTKPTVVN